MELLKIIDITTHQMNPNFMSKQNLDRLRELIVKEDNYPPLIVNKRNGKYVLLDGHQRLTVLRELGRHEAKVDIWEVDEETELMVLATINKVRGQFSGKKKKALYEILKQKLNYDEIKKISPESKKFIDDLFNIAMKKKEMMDNIDTRVTFYQRLTREQFEYVWDFINTNFNIKERDEAIYYIIRRLNEIDKESVQR